MRVQQVHRCVALEVQHVIKAEPAGTGQAFKTSSPYGFQVGHGLIAYCLAHKIAGADKLGAGCSSQQIQITMACSMSPQGRHEQPAAELPCST